MQNAQARAHTHNSTTHTSHIGTTFEQPLPTRTRACARRAYVTLQLCSPAADRNKSSYTVRPGEEMGSEGHVHGGKPWFPARTGSPALCQCCPQPLLGSCPGSRGALWLRWGQGVVSGVRELKL